MTCQIVRRLFCSARPPRCSVASSLFLVHPNSSSFSIFFQHLYSVQTAVSNIPKSRQNLPRPNPLWATGDHSAHLVAALSIACALPALQFAPLRCAVTASSVSAASLRIIPPLHPLELGIDLLYSTGVFHCDPKVFLIVDRISY